MKRAIGWCIWLGNARKVILHTNRQIGVSMCIHFPFRISTCAYTPDGSIYSTRFLTISNSRYIPAWIVVLENKSLIVCALYGVYT